MKTQEIDFLKSIKIFSLLNDDEIRSLRKFLYQTNAEKDEVLFYEGDPGNKMYLVKNGIVDVYTNINSQNQRKIASFYPGDFFGEMAIFQKNRRSGTCITRSESWFYILPADEFLQFLNQKPDIAIKIMYKILNTITDRLQDTSSLLSDLVTWGDKAVRRTITDELTGVYNRKFFEETLPEIYNLHLNNKKPLTMIMSDLDHFGTINKNHGQKTGDQAITSVAAIYKKIFRKNDLVCRFGGDEFAMILPDTTCEQAVKIIRKVLTGIRSIETVHDAHGNLIRLSVSAGLVSLNHDHPVTVQEFKDLSDRALYLAKEEGRNCYKIADFLKK